MIVGSAEDGSIRSFNTVYYVMRLILMGKLSVLPISRQQRLNIIPVDAEKDTLHSQIFPENLYIADAALLPKAMGNPPILTIMALAKRIAGIIAHLK